MIDLSAEKKTADGKNQQGVVVNLPFDDNIQPFGYSFNEGRLLSIVDNASKMVKTFIITPLPNSRVVP
jgi:hypothetical protein